jgi:hypothetical protein
MFVLVAAAAGCAEELEPGSPDADPPEEPDDRVVHTDDGDGVTTTRVDATADGWLHLDLEGRREVGDADGWELAFQRFQIVVNGGVSGDGGVEVAIVEGGDFAAIERAPAGGYLTDAADGEDEGSEPDLAFGGWYDYDPATHVLTPRDQVYVLRSAEGYWKLQLVDYYDDAGTSGFPTFRWAAVTAPEDE